MLAVLHCAALAAAPAFAGCHWNMSLTSESALLSALQTQTADFALLQPQDCWLRMYFVAQFAACVIYWPVAEKQVCGAPHFRCSS